MLFKDRRGGAALCAWTKNRYYMVLCADTRDFYWGLKIGFLDVMACGEGG